MQNRTIPTCFQTTIAYSSQLWLTPFAPTPVRGRVREVAETKSLRIESEETLATCNNPVDIPLVDQDFIHNLQKWVGFQPSPVMVGLWHWNSHIQICKFIYFPKDISQPFPIFFVNHIVNL